MKKLYCLIILALVCNLAFAAKITSIKGPETICSSGSTTYTVNYELAWSWPLTTYDQLTDVKWEFIKNGSVVKTLYSSNYPTIIPEGSAKISVSGLPSGDIKVKVTLYYIFRSTYLPPVPLTKDKTKDIYVGLQAPGGIDGNSYICNSGVFAAETVSGATNYTWEVPAGWKVNGIPGPVVPNQGSLVGILPCTDGSCPAFSSHIIKVKAVSTTCGESPYTIKTITIDQPFIISETNLLAGRAKLSVSETTLLSYAWTLPAAWTNVSGVNTSSVSFTHNNVSGYASLVVKTVCDKTYTRTYYYSAPVQPGGPDDPNPGDCNGPEAPVIRMTTAKSGNIVYLRDPCEEELYQAAIYDLGSLKPVVLTKNHDGYEFDISSLKAGAYVLHLKTASGKLKTAKFIRVD